MREKYRLFDDQSIKAMQVSDKGKKKGGGDWKRLKSEIQIFRIRENVELI